MRKLEDTCLSNRITFLNSRGDLCELYDNQQIRSHKVPQYIELSIIYIIGSRLAVCT